MKNRGTASIDHWVPWTAMLCFACSFSPSSGSSSRAPQPLETATGRPTAAPVVGVSTRPHPDRDAPSRTTGTPGKQTRADVISTPERNTRSPILPPTVAVGKTTELFVPSDFNIRVTHAPATQSQAIVYLPGMCGNPKGADPWSDIAAQHGTLIVVRANVKCPDRPGYKWPQDVTLIQERIRAALRRVQGSRDGLLNVETPILVGYSQGAHRAERLAEAYPSMYRRVVLGGPPTAPEPDSLAHALAVAVLGGELENSDHMQAGTAALREAGLHARFFLLPGAYHGGYGPDGRHVMTQVFGFLDVGK